MLSNDPEKQSGFNDLTTPALDPVAKLLSELAQGVGSKPYFGAEVEQRFKERVDQALELGPYDPAVATALETYLSHRNQAFRREAARYFTASPATPKYATDALHSMLGRNDPETTNLALFAIRNGHITAPKMLPALIEALFVPETTLEAIRTISRLGADGFKSLEILSYLSKEETEKSEIRVAAISAIASIVEKSLAREVESTKSPLSRWAKLKLDWKYVDYDMLMTEVEHQPNQQTSSVVKNAAHQAGSRIHEALMRMKMAE